MKSARCLLRLFAFAVLLASPLLTGCNFIPAASTKIRVPLANGQSAELVLPKNVHADSLDIVIDPKTGEYRLKAKTLRTDASGVIDSAATAQAQALGSLAETVRALVPLAPGVKP